MSGGGPADPSAERPKAGHPSRRTALTVLGLFVAVFLGAGVHQAGRDSLTVDEAVELTAGLVAVNHQDLRMNPEHGLLHRVLPSIAPSLLADPIVPRTASYRDGDWFEYTEDVIAVNEEAGRLDGIVFWFRMAPLAAGALTGAAIYAIGARFVGRLGGLVAAGLWLTTPYVVGLAHVSGIDVSFSLAVVVVALTIDRWWISPSPARIAAVAAALGTALLVRHTAIVLVPVVLGVVVVRSWRSPSATLLARLAAVTVITLSLVWASHRIIDPTPVDGPPRHRFEGLIATAADEGPVERLALAAPMPLEWRAGLAYLVVTSEPRPAYLAGEWWQGSRPYYFPANAAVKLPATFAIAVVVGAVGWSRTSRGEGIRATVAVALPALGISLFLLAQPLNLGLRLALPVVALAAVIASGVARLPKTPALAALVVIGIGQAVSFISAHPTSLAWSPYPFGDGYRYVSDSSIDIGQANAAVREEHDREPFAAVSLLQPRGYEPLAGVPSVASADASDLVGRVAVSATNLTTLQYQQLSWLRSYCPVDVIEHAVLVYRFDTPPNMTPGPSTPRPPCPGSEVSRR